MNITKEDVGMWVYDLRRKEFGEIIDFDDRFDCAVDVQFSPHDVDTYTADGRRYLEDKGQTIYWDKPEIIAPPKPERKVKKTYWLCLEKLPDKKVHIGPYLLYESKDDCCFNELEDRDEKDVTFVSFELEGEE